MYQHSDKYRITAVAATTKVERDIIASLHQLWYWDLHNCLYCYCF